MTQNENEQEERSPQDAVLADLGKRVKLALESWYEHGATTTSLSDLRLFKVEAAARVDRGEVEESARLVTNELLLRGLAALGIESDRQAQLLRARYIERLTAYAAGGMVNIAESTVYVTQKEAIVRLAELLFEMEEQAQDAFTTHMEQRIGASMYSDWVGLDEPVAALGKVLRQDGSPWIVSIEGLGGIGKTTLASAVTKEMLSTQVFDDFGWSTARQVMLDPDGQIIAVDGPDIPQADEVIDDVPGATSGLASKSVHGVINELFVQLCEDEDVGSPLSVDEKLDALEARLHKYPHLVVIDNLETLDDLEALTPILKRLINPSKIVITSRERFYAEMGVYRHGVSELSLANAIVLIRQEARLNNLPYINESGDEDLRPIYEIVGGNPLALRLVLGQIYMQSLQTILDNLVQAQGEKAENLYTYIYRSAWDSLSEDERLVLLAMPMVIDAGGELAFLAATSGLTAERVWQGLNGLMQRNLVDGVGNLNERRYLIHSLTRTFLVEQVGRW